MNKQILLLGIGITGIGTAGFSQVGIGTTSPTVELDIESSAATTSIDINNTAADGDPQINFQLSGTTTFSMGVDDTDDFFKIGTTAPDASNRLTIDNSGNVGIGTETPVYLLDVQGNAGFNEYIYHNGDPDSYIRFQDDEADISIGNFMMIHMTESFGASSVVVNDLQEDIDFLVEGDNNGGLFFVDAGNDRIGVNTVNPSYTFEVSDDAAVGGGATNNSGDSEYLTVLGQSDNWYMAVQNEATTGASDFFIGLNTLEDGMFHIENGGNIGIGTATPGYKLDVQGDVGFNEYIYHNSDADSYIRLIDDQIQVYSGGEYMINCYEDAANNVVAINEGAGDVDFRVEGTGATDLLKVDAGLDKIGVNEATPTSTLDINGSVSMTTTAISTGTTLDDTHYMVLCDASGAGFTVTLPAVASSAGRVYVIKEAVGSTNTITIDGNGAELIDGAATKAMSVAYASVKIICDGAAWYVISE